MNRVGNNKCALRRGFAPLVGIMCAFVERPLIVSLTLLAIPGLTGCGRSSDSNNHNPGSSKPPRDNRPSASTPTPNFTPNGGAPTIPTPTGTVRPGSTPNARSSLNESTFGGGTTERNSKHYTLSLTQGQFAPLDLYVSDQTHYTLQAKSNLLVDEVDQ